MTQIVDLLAEKKTCTFDELFVTARVKYEVVVTFLALLEMTKMRILRIYQPGSRGVLHVEYRLLDSSLASYPPEASAFAEVTSDAKMEEAPVPTEFKAPAFKEEAHDDGEFDEAELAALGLTKADMDALEDEDDADTSADDEEELYQ